jgi:hypothetical protein
MSGFHRALERDDLDGAEKEIREVTAGLSDVPAFAAFGRLYQDGIGHLRALRAAADQVPPAAKAFGDHHYALIILPLGWNDARIFCERYGAHLATVSSPEEQAWITEQFGLPSFGRTFWLGGTDEGNEGYWKWVSGERWQYENWTSPEPNNSDGVEHALAMKADGWWFDANGGALRLPLLMEWDK